MGTKRALGPAIVDVQRACKKGPFLDLFSGICAVGRMVGTSRQIWCNDIQRFAWLVATTHFGSSDYPIMSIQAADMAYNHYNRNKKALVKRYGEFLKLERKTLNSNELSKLADLPTDIPHIGICRELDRERKRLARKKNTFPYRLFTITFAGGYFGVEQAIEIDSIRYAIDKLKEEERIGKGNYRWLILALCQILCKVATTTGHFAQYLKIKESNKNRFIAQRNKSAWLAWLNAIDGSVPIGWKSWRMNNRVFNMDALKLLEYIQNNGLKPAVVYADPPYTDDQYSRYYHIYETLILYDYPDSRGEGRYRSDRFTSDFSLATKVDSAFSRLIEQTASLGSEMIITYPENGLMRDLPDKLLSMLRFCFNKIERMKLIEHCHSSLGASKGNVKQHVREMIIHAR